MSFRSKSLQIQVYTRFCSEFSLFESLPHALIQSRQYSPQTTLVMHFPSPKTNRCHLQSILGSQAACTPHKKILDLKDQNLPAHRKCLRAPPATSQQHEPSDHRFVSNLLRSQYPVWWLWATATSGKTNSANYSILFTETQYHQPPPPQKFPEMEFKKG